MCRGDPRDARACTSCALSRDLSPALHNPHRLRQLKPLVDAMYRERSLIEPAPPAVGAVARTSRQDHGGSNLRSSVGAAFQPLRDAAPAAAAATSTRGLTDSGDIIGAAGPAATSHARPAAKRSRWGAPEHEAPAANEEGRRGAAQPPLPDDPPLPEPPPLPPAPPPPLPPPPPPPMPMPPREVVMPAYDDL